MKKYKEAQKLLKQIDKKLIKHKKEFEKDDTNWGSVGDIGSWVELLNDILG